MQPKNDAEPRRAVRHDVGITIEMSRQFNKNRPDICKEKDCQISMHTTCTYETHIRHNTACYAIPIKYLDDLGYDLWGGLLTPWMEKEHEQTG